tara:strand:- start:3658 stop:4920 length:1263 start_codon:yes stop_codon:yes gene_type:complete
MNPAKISFSRIGQLANPPIISHIMAVALENPDMLSLAAGFTDTKALPVQPVRDATLALSSNGKTPEYLQYGTTIGRPKLRKFVAKRLSQIDQHQSPAYNLDNVMLTTGSQQALYLAIQVLCDPGDILLVESPSYFVFLELLKGLGIQAVGIPVDENDEMDTVALSGMLAGWQSEGSLDKVKGVYIESWFSNPSTHCLSNGEKTALAEVLKEAGLLVPILEDGAYMELYFEEAFPSTSIFAIEAFDGFPRLFFGTFTKPFASGLKVGYAICDHSDILSKMVNVKGHHDFGSSNFTQSIVETAMTDGSYDAQLNKGRDRYLQKMEILNEVLIQQGLPDSGWNWQKPAGGMYFWVKGPVQADTSIESAMFENAVKEGVLYVPGDLCFAPEGPKSYMRLTYGVLERDDLAEAGQRLANVIKQSN